MSLRWGWTNKEWTAQNAGENVIIHRARMGQPERWKRPRMVFVNSMSDLFHKQIDDATIDRIFGTMMDVSRHIYQILTKRPKRMFQFFYDRPLLSDMMKTSRHIWMGVSAEDQKTADERIALLQDTPALIRFVSFEPLLGPIQFRERWHTWEQPVYHGDETRMMPVLSSPKLSWVIVGGESGPNNRPMKQEWAESLLGQCREHNIPFFGKQSNGWRSGIPLLFNGEEIQEFPNIVKSWEGYNGGSGTGD
jgi:protein gp37